ARGLWDETDDEPSAPGTAAPSAAFDRWQQLHRASSRDALQAWRRSERLPQSIHRSCSPIPPGRGVGGGMVSSLGQRVLLPKSPADAGLSTSRLVVSRRICAECAV